MGNFYDLNLYSSLEGGEMLVGNVSLLKCGEMLSVVGNANLTLTCFLLWGEDSKFMLSASKFG